MQSRESPAPLKATAKKLTRLPGAFSGYRLFIRPLFFFFDAETMHHLVLGLARLFLNIPLGPLLTRAVYARGVRPMPVQLGGIEALNPIGLAAGFDKNALLIPGIENLGFGFVEVGTVTPRPQLGNPRPRLSRIPEKRALLNRMGFNNDGAEIISEQLKRVRVSLKVPVGVNLGKNRDTPNTEAIKDYEFLFKAFGQSASYFVINISSPNTPGLRDLQNGEFVKSLGASIQAQRVTQPVFVKLAPDIDVEDLRAISALCGEGKPYTGLILCNTIPTDLGGLSGFPLKGPSVSLLRTARTLVPAAVPIISVGGIETAEDVMERFTLGANAVQLYSALIYSGPGLPGRILRELQAKMRRKGIRQLTDLRQH